MAERIRTSSLQRKIDFSEVSDQLLPYYGLGRFLRNSSTNEPTIIDYFNQEYKDALNKWIPAVLGYAVGHLASVGLAGWLISKTF